MFGLSQIKDVLSLGGVLSKADGGGLQRDDLVEGSKAAIGQLDNMMKTALIFKSQVVESFERTHTRLANIYPCFGKL